MARPDELHGYVYTLSKETLAAFSFDIDRSGHELLHRRAELQRAIDTQDRAAAFYAAAQSPLAQREASIAISLLRPIVDRPEFSSVELLAAHKVLADGHALLAQPGSRPDTADHVARAGAEYLIKSVDSR